MPSINGSMATDRPERYAKQLTSHWSSRGPVTEEDGAIVQRWSTGQILTLRPLADVLAVQVEVPADQDLTRFAEVVKVHLERFAQRDELTVVWDDPPPARPA
jgi:hypothetical protein